MELLLQPEVLMALGLVAVVAGFVDTLAGGGGLIVIPALLLAQVPPVFAIATNKLQGTFGTFTAAWTMVRKKLVEPRRLIAGFTMAFTGSAFGALVIQYIPAHWVKIIVPLVLTITALYFLLTRQRGDDAIAARMQTSRFDRYVVPVVGFYDGAFGPGAGSFYTLGHASLLGRKILDATARAKVLNFASNLAALLVFAAGGKVLWLVGGVMIAGAMLGAYAGSLVVISRGNRVIRPAIVTMSLVMLCVYVLKSF